MPSFKKSLLALYAVTAIASAQSSIVVGAGAFVDISPAGNALGTAILAVTDDSVHNITTTIGNDLFPAGPVRIGNNGFAIAGTTNATVSLTNATIAASGLPVGVTAGTLPGPAYSYLMPHWDDLDPIGTTSGAITIYWWENTTNNILYIQWNNDGHFSDVAGQTITFQIQVIGGANTSCNGVVNAKYAYLDTTFGGTQAALDNGASATVGLVRGSATNFSNAQFSFDTASLSAGLILDVIGVPGVTTSLAMSSPGGPGDLQVDIVATGPCASGQYFLAVTFAAGLFPAGWFFGLDIPLADVSAQFQAGFPFVGPLIPGVGLASFTIGPIGAGALPSGFQLWAVAAYLPTGGNGAPKSPSPAITYTIP